MANWTAQDIPSQEGRVAIVTGSNSGLGLDTAAGLEPKVAHVIMACRSRDKAEQAMTQIRSASPQARLEFMPLDLSDLASVRRFATDVAKDYPRVDLLINNAGVMALPLRRTRDGFEMQIGTNHLGHFALTGLLLDRLKAAPGARVVNVSSLAHRGAKGMNLDDLNFERSKYRKWDAYCKSKLANLLFTFELGRRLQKSGAQIKVAAAHPGYSVTNLQFVGPQMEQSAVGNLVMKIGNALFGQPSAMGALPTLYAATAPDVESGDYFGPGGFQELRGHPKKVATRRTARDPELASGLWSLSEQLTGVKYPG
jgi:NAD(P)-dependent dehydrogenase (short-subunit alcohol dehydrogenase family)